MKEHILLIKAIPINEALIKATRIPAPLLSAWWNFGSLLGLCLGLQIATGLFLALQYTAFTDLSFAVVRRIIQEVQSGWILRVLHANGARFFFLCLYLHAGRGLYYSSFRSVITWVVGTFILLITMATAFLGYVLPWGQISFWGTTVITNLLSAIPYVGQEAVIWLWGGFAVINPTLTRFFTFHFLCPFIILFLVAVHILCLHSRGSRNPLGLIAAQRVGFSSVYNVKDVAGVLLFSLFLLLLATLAPWLLGDPENFINANPLVTPVHIQPEWYFLFAYAVLRSIPNKLGGVVALALAVLILLVLIWTPFSFSKSGRYYPFYSLYFWCLVRSVLLLTWVGARPVEEPFVLLGQLTACFYFLFFLVSGISRKLWDEWVI